jgi:hypothetical protein
MCTRKHRLGRTLAGLIALSQVGACENARVLDLPPGTQVVLLIDAQPTVTPEGAAASVPVSDSMTATLTVTRATSDSIWGQHSGDLVHFPARVPGDTAQTRPFVGYRDGTLWHIDLHAGLTDAGVVLTLDPLNSAHTGTWINRTIVLASGRFRLQRPGT